MFHIKAISNADHVLRLSDPAKDTKGPQQAPSTLQTSKWEMHEGLS